MSEIVFPYTSEELTQEVNRIPNTYGLLNALNVFPNEPKGSKYVRIGYKDGQIYVLAAEERGAPGDVGENDQEHSILLEIPHFPHLDFVTPDDVDNLLTIVNGQLQSDSLDRVMAEKLKAIRNKHAITREFIRLGALRGEIKDGKNRVLYNIYSVFGIQKKQVDFKLGTEGTNVFDKCEEVLDHIQSNLRGETMTQVEAIVSPSFFSKLIAHKNVEKFWLMAQNSAYHQELRRQYAGGNWGRLVEFGDILFREYKGSLPVKNSSGQITSVPNVASGKGYAYPAGTQAMFKTFDGPAFHVARVNTAIDPKSEPILITPEEMKHGTGWELKSQSNVLAICKQPECVVELTTSD